MAQPDPKRACTAKRAHQKGPLNAGAGNGEGDAVGAGVAVGGEDRLPERTGAAVGDGGDGERRRHRAVLERLNPEPAGGPRCARWPGAPRDGAADLQPGEQ